MTMIDGNTCEFKITLCDGTERVYKKTGVLYLTDLLEFFNTCVLVAEYSPPDNSVLEFVDEEKD